MRMLEEVKTKGKCKDYLYIFVTFPLHISSSSLTLHSSPRKCWIFKALIFPFTLPLYKLSFSSCYFYLSCAPLSLLFISLEQELTAHSAIFLAKSLLLFCFMRIREGEEEERRGGSLKTFMASLCHTKQTAFSIKSFCIHTAILACCKLICVGNFVSSLPPSFSSDFIWTALFHHPFILISFYDTLGINHHS